MILPNLTDIKVANNDGSMHEDFKGLMTQLIQTLQQSLSDEGYDLPKQTTDNVNLLNTAQSEGRILYNNDTKQAMINLNGTFKTITTS